jgi:two-component system, NarL family, sensor kinase
MQPTELKSMINRCIFFLACMLCAHTNAQQPSAQHEIDSVTAQRKNDTDKIKDLVEGSWNCALNGDSSIFRWQKAIAAMLPGLPADKYAIQMSASNSCLGTYYMFTGKYDSSEKYYNENLQMGIANKNNVIIVKAYNNLGNVANHRSDYEKAIEYFQYALKYAEEMHDSDLLCSGQGNIANSYIRLKQYNKAITALQAALPIATARHNKRLTANLYNSLATAYGELKNDTLELKNQLLSYGIYKELKNVKGLATSSLNLGAVHLRLRNMDEAKKYLLESITYEVQIDDEENLAESYQYLCDAYLKDKDYTRSLAANDSGMSYAIRTGDKNLMAHTYRLRAEVLYNLQQFKEAYDYLEKVRVLNDSIFNSDMTARVAEMETKYETAKKEQKIAQQSLQLSRQRMVSIAVVALLLLALVTAYSLYRRMKLKQQARLQQEINSQQKMAAQAVLEAEEKERTRIASDLHDGVGQTMTAAKMNLSAIESGISFETKEQEIQFHKVINLIDAGCREVRTVSHNMMSNTLIKAGLSGAIKEFIHHIDSRLLKVDLYTEGLNERIDANTENVLYRVIQECVNNVIKHAEATHLDISLVKDNDGLSITIEDNGKGFDLAGKASFEGIGLKNIEARTKYLGGKAEWSSAPGKGTIVAIHIPQ